jgi:hypothetical protein
MISDGPKLREEWFLQYFILFFHNVLSSAVRDVAATLFDVIDRYHEYPLMQIQRKKIQLVQKERGRTK